MVIQPIVPSIIYPPVVNPVVREFIIENIISTEVLLLIFKMILITVGAILIGLLLNRNMAKEGFKTNRSITVILTATMAILLSLRFGMSIYTIQGLFLFFLLLYASASDISTRHIPNHVSISILALALISAPRIGFTSMLIGGIVTTVIMLAVAICSDGRGAGADWKIAASCAFLLGWSRGLLGLIIGELIAVIFTLIYRKTKCKNCKASFALLPFLAIGMMLTFFI